MSRNVRIESTFLGLENHGIPSFMLHTISGGLAQGFGGWDLRFYGIDILIKILDVVGVSSWEKIPGSYCRVKENSTGGLSAIGHITDDKWLHPEDCEEIERKS